MSFVTTVRDYVDFINQSYDSMWSHGNLLENLLFIFSHTLLYLFESIKYGLFYLLTFRWLTDLLYLPSWTPHLSKALLRENFYPLQNPLVNSFTLLEVPPLLHNKFFVGFLNSFFVSSCCTPLISGRYSGRNRSGDGNDCWSILFPRLDSLWLEMATYSVALLRAS